MHYGQQVSGISTKGRLIDTLGLGFTLWAIGYAVGMIAFSLVPPSMIGGNVIPVMIPITAYAAFVRLKAGSKSLRYLMLMGLVWTSIAVSFDYIFLVGAFDVLNYYDFDVLIYYSLDFLIPPIVGLTSRRLRHNR